MLLLSKTDTKKKESKTNMLFDKIKPRNFIINFVLHMLYHGSSIKDPSGPKPKFILF